MENLTFKKFAHKLRDCGKANYNHGHACNGTSKVLGLRHFFQLIRLGPGNQIYDAVHTAHEDAGVASNLVERA